MLNHSELKRNSQGIFLELIRGGGLPLKDFDYKGPTVGGQPIKIF